MSSPRGTVSGRRLANRKEVLDELAASEGKYVKKLKALAQAYMIPLHEARVLTAGELSSVFRGLVDMVNVHAKLSGILAAAAEEDNVAQGMAIVSDEFRAAKAALLELYVAFGRGHDAALRCLRTALARPDVARAVDAIAAGDERVRGLALQDLLCAPLDRIAEYRDLLSSLASFSSPSDRGFPGLQEATDLLSAVLRDAVANGYAPPSAAQTGSGGSGMGMSMSGSGVFGAAPGGAAAAAAAAAASAQGASGGYGSHPSAATQALVAAAMPMNLAYEGSGASSGAGAGGAASSGAGMGMSMGGGDGHLTTEAVLSAQAEAEEASRRLEALEREVSLRESELALTSREVARAEAEKARRLVPGSGPGSSSAAAAEAGPLEEALRSLGEEERELLSRVSGSEHRALFEAFLARKRELEEEEARLSEALEEHEDTLAKVRARLANPPQSVLPADPAKASLYIAWKRALAEREELLRQARKRKHELLRDLKARHETQVVLLELERRAAVEGLRESVASERAKVEGYKADLAALDESIEAARSAMTRFRQEFEQLRVALLIDRMAKSSQVANLADRRRRLAREAEQFAEAVEAAKQRVAAEEASKWEAKLASEKAAGESRVAEERAAIEAKIERVRAALAERYEAGFKPLLAEAEARHVDELNKIVALQKELEAKESELRAAQESARAVSAAVSALTGASTGDDASAASSTGAGAGGEEVPDWKLREFADLRNAVASMWEQLDVPAEDVAAFLSECDLLAPFSPAVLSMYQDMYRRLTNAAAAAAVAATAPALAGGSGSAPGSPSGHGYGHGSAGASPALGSAPAGRAAAAAIAAGSPGGLGHGSGYDGESATSAAARANALAAQYEEASAAAAARARAAATALASAPLAMTMTASSEGMGGGMGTPASGAAQARGRTPGSAAGNGNAGGNGNSGAFRSTLFSSGGRGGSEEAEAQAYLARLAASRAQLPPSLGGPGARAAHARGGSIHVPAGEGMVRRSPSPSAGRYGAPYGTRASSSHPATPQTVAGPAFKFGAPDKTVRGFVCEQPGAGSDANMEAEGKAGFAAAHYMRAVPSWCVGPLCLRRYNAALEPANNGSVPRLRVIGSIVDTRGRPIPSAELELWQTDSAGAYGDLTPGREDGYCRARILANSNGHFAFETSPPGAYGLMMGALGGGWEIPPVGPQHIHALVTHPSWAAASATSTTSSAAKPASERRGTGVYAAQWYLPDDEAAQVHDAREALRSLRRWLGLKLPMAVGGHAKPVGERDPDSQRHVELGTGSGHPALQLHIEPCSRTYRAEWRQIIRGHGHSYHDHDASSHRHGHGDSSRSSGAAALSPSPGLCARIHVVVPDSVSGGRRARAGDTWAAGEREKMIADVVCKQPASPVAVCRPQLLPLYRPRFLSAASAVTAFAVTAAVLWAPLQRLWRVITKRMPLIQVH